MTEELELILSQLTQPDNAVIQQVKSHITLSLLALALLTLLNEEKVGKTKCNGLLTVNELS